MVLAVSSVLTTVRSRYIEVYFLLITHESYGCFPWDHNLAEVLPSNSVYCVLCRVIWYPDISIGMYSIVNRSQFEKLPTIAYSAFGKILQLSVISGAIYHIRVWWRIYALVNSATIGSIKSLLWLHNGHHSVSNHQPYDCLLRRSFRRRSKQTSKLRVTGLCAGNSPEPVNFPHKWSVTQKMFPFDDVIM